MGYIQWGTGLFFGIWICFGLVLAFLVFRDEMRHPTPLFIFFSERWDR